MNVSSSARRCPGQDSSAWNAQLRYLAKALRHSASQAADDGFKRGHTAALPPCTISRLHQPNT